MKMLVNQQSVLSVLVYSRVVHRQINQQITTKNQLNVIIIKYKFDQRLFLAESLRPRRVLSIGKYMH